MALAIFIGQPSPNGDTAGAVSVCCLSELVFELSAKSFWIPRLAVALYGSLGPLERMTFCGVISDPDGDIIVKGADRRRPRSL